MSPTTVQQLSALARILNPIKSPVGIIAMPANKIQLIFSPLQMSKYPTRTRTNRKQNNTPGNKSVNPETFYLICHSD